VVVTPTTVTVSEPATADTYTVVLLTQPAAGEIVTITTSGYNAAWIGVTATVTFDDTNWNVPHVVTVTPVDNFLDDDTRTTTITNGVSSNQATHYNDGTVTASNVLVTVQDDEVAGVIVTPTTVTVTENGPVQSY
jgi:hypothetical protein